MFIRILAIILILSGNIYGQINTEKLRLSLKDTGFYGDIKLSYSVIAGNSELSTVGLAPNFVWRYHRHQVFMLNDLKRVYHEDQSIVNRAFSHLRYNYDLTDMVIVEFFLQAQYDKSQDLGHRYLAGAGLRFLPYQKDEFLVAVGITPMYEDEELTTGDEFDNFRLSSYIFTKIFKEKLITFQNTVYMQPAIEDPGDYRILDEAELAVWFYNDLAITTSLNYRYDSHPPAGVEKYDLEIANGLKYKFKL